MFRPHRPTSAVRACAAARFAALLLLLLLLLTGCGRKSHPDRNAPPPPEPQTTHVRLLFAGDLMQHKPQVDAALHDTAADYSPVFEALRPRIEAADLAVVNLETTLTRTHNYTGYPLFRSPVALARAIRDAGFDVATTANNHCCDGGTAGIRTTCEELDRSGILRTGTFVDSLDRAARNPLFVTRRGVRFALLAYTYGTNGLPVPEGMLVNHIDTVQMAADLALARARRADCIIVCIHWGVEYARMPDAQQRRIGRFLRQQGAALVIGSHPHVVQPIEADSTGAIVYSLGNFVSNQRKRYCDGGIVVEVDAVRHADGHLTCSLDAVPVWVALPGYRILPPEAADTAALPPAYRQFRRDVAEVLGSI